MPCHGTLFYLILNRGAVLAVFFERELFINYVRRYMKVAEKVVEVKSFS